MAFRNFLKDHQVLLMAVVLAAIFVCWQDTGRFYPILGINGSIVSIDTKTGTVAWVCDVRGDYCEKWDGVNASSEDFYELYLNKARKEAGLPENE